MKFLHITPLNNSNLGGILRKYFSEEKKIRYDVLSLFKNEFNFQDDICLNLKWHPKKGFNRKIQKLLLGNEKSYNDYTPRSKERVYYKTLSGKFYKTLFFRLRDAINRPIINKAIKEYDLLNYNFYIYETGTPLSRDFYFEKKLVENNKKFMNWYIGLDVRTRGIHRFMDENAIKSITSELDHLSLKPDLGYIFPPFNEILLEKPSFNNNEKLQIVHAPRNRVTKGTDKILEFMDQIKLTHGHLFDFHLLENKTFDEVIEVKRKCDLLIEQIGDNSGWGYGANSREAFALGLAVASEMNEHYEKFIPDHPFININENNFKEKIIRVIEDRELLNSKKKEGHIWLKRTHSVENAVNTIIEIYKGA